VNDECPVASTWWVEAHAPMWLTVPALAPLATTETLSKCRSLWLQQGGGGGHARGGLGCGRWVTLLCGVGGGRAALSGGGTTPLRLRADITSTVPFVSQAEGARGHMRLW
jgi:hypothetical protein